MSKYVKKIEEKIIIEKNITLETNTTIELFELMELLDNLLDGESMIINHKNLKEYLLTNNLICYDGVSYSSVKLNCENKKEFLVLYNEIKELYEKE